MITNFNQHTAPLTTSEVVLMNKIACFLRSEARKGSEINNQQIDEHFSSPGQSLGAARIRKIINHIRLYGVVPCLIANSKGYYVSSDAAEIDEYINSLHQRAGAILAVENAIKKQRSAPAPVPQPPVPPRQTKSLISNIKHRISKTQQPELFEEENLTWPQWKSTFLKGANPAHP